MRNLDVNKGRIPVEKQIMRDRMMKYKAAPRTIKKGSQKKMSTVHLNIITELPKIESLSQKSKITKPMNKQMNPLIDERGLINKGFQS